MGLRFQKCIRIFNGLMLNLCKSGTSWTSGGRGASVNLKDGKATGNIRIPGTELSYRGKLTDADAAKSNPMPGKSRGSLGITIVIFVLIAIGYLLGKVT